MCQYGPVRTTSKIGAALIERARQMVSAGFTVLCRKRADTHKAKPEVRFRLRDGSYGEGGMVEPMNWEEMRDEIYHGRGA
jgi:hypothetical protein